MAIDFGPAGRQAARRYARNSTRPITGTVLREREKALLIRTATREAWVPRSLRELEERP